MTDPDQLRARSIVRLPLGDRLLALRRDALRQLAACNGVDPGMLRLVADTSAALAALDTAAAEAVPPVPGDRALVTDNGHEIMVTVYSSDRRAAAAVLSPAAALRLASQLVASGMRRL